MFIILLCNVIMFSQIHFNLVGNNKLLKNIYHLNCFTDCNNYTTKKKLQKYVNEQKRIFKVNLAFCNTANQNFSQWLFELV